VLKNGNLLGLAVLCESEIVLGKSVNRRTGLVADRHIHDNQIAGDRKLVSLGGTRRKRRGRLRLLLRRKRQHRHHTGKDPESSHMI
jgi:hypothetical protein